MHVLRLTACSLVSCALTVPAWAQDPLPTENPGDAATAATAADGGQIVAAANGQTPRAADGNGDRNPNIFKLVGGDFKNFFSTDTAKVMSYFSVAAVAAAPWDREGVNNGFNIPTAPVPVRQRRRQLRVPDRRRRCEYGLGRSSNDPRPPRRPRHHPRADSVAGARAGLKYTIQRERPDGSNNLSFPSGHAASAFATAGVIHKHYGWKGGIPAYAFGGYVALARMSWNKHHATDVVMGAGLGLASARTVTIGAGGNKFSVGVQPQTGGASVNISKIYK